MQDDKSRCFWAMNDPLMMSYHDQEWGDPVHDDRKLFEYMILDAFQAGLSWRTILYKRENFRRAFHDFDVLKISRYNDSDIKRLLGNAGIVRNRLKIEATIQNAIHFIEIQREFGSFDKYIWQFSDFRTLRNPDGLSRDSIPTHSAESDAMSADLRQRGFRFVGTTICYAFMQAIGMVDDHVVGCFKYQVR